MEQWRQIVNPKYKDYYWVNTDGFVKSTYGGKEKIITRRLDADGYMRVELSRVDGSRVAVKTHILVAEAFLEKPESDEELEVSHLDDNRANSKLSNLEWSTHADNQKRIKGGYTKNKYGIFIATRGDVVLRAPTAKALADLIGTSNLTVLRHLHNGRPTASNWMITEERNNEESNF